MERPNNQKIGKSRLSNDETEPLSEGINEALPNKLKPKFSFMKIALILFGFFILLVIASVIYKMYLRSNVVETSLDDKGEELVFENIEVDEGIKEDINDNLILIDEDVIYDQPERIYHIEKRQQFCAKDVKQARVLYSDYIDVKNRQVLEVKPLNISKEQWIEEKRSQGVYRENLGEREEDYYFEYPTTAGPYVDLIRIHKCNIFNPEGRIIPIISVEEDGYISEYELGVMDLENLSEDDMTLFIGYLISLRHDEELVSDIRKKTSGDYLTITLRIEDEDVSKLIDLKVGQEVYEESIYKLNLKTGTLKYSAQLLTSESNME